MPDFGSFPIDFHTLPTEIRTVVGFEANSDGKLFLSVLWVKISEYENILIINVNTRVG